MADNHWEKLSSKIIYKNPWLTLREDTVITPDGKDGIYGVIERHDGVFVIALTDDDEIYLVNLFRYTTQMDSWEVPAGSIDEGEDLLLGAKRELQEETGLAAEKWECIGKSQAVPGISNQIHHTYIARNLSQTKVNQQAEEGITSIQKVPFTEVFAMIKSGAITDGPSIVALTQAALHLNKFI